MFEKIKEKISIFDLILGSLLLITLFIFYLFFYRRSEFITIKIKVTDQDILYANTMPHDWYAQQFRVGDVETDVAGRVISEVTRVESFNTSAEKKAVYLDLKVKSTYSKNSNTYSVKGRKVIFGSPMRFNLDRITFDGYVVDFPGLDSDITDEYIEIEALSRNVESAVSTSIKVGMQIIDSNEQILAEVVKVRVSPAEQVSEDAYGNLLLRYNPIYKDIKMTLRVKTKVLNGQRFMFDNVPIVIGEIIPLNFKDVSIFPLITSINEVAVE